MKSILFVCTGNTCRSPMAEAVFNELCPKDLGYIGESCGLCADGSEISENAVSALCEIGITKFTHTSRSITRELIYSSYAVFCVSTRHASALCSAFPEYAERIFVFPSDIPDPYGGDLSVYRNTLSEIVKAVKKIIAALKLKDGEDENDV